MNLSYSVHAPLETQTVWVNESVFYDLEKGHDNWIKVKLFGLTCIQGRVPTFEVITHEGYVFSDIPVHLIRWKNKEDTNKDYKLSSLVYNNCLSENFAISDFPELKSKVAFIFLKDEKQYEQGQYMFSLDFYKNNNWYHCMKLDNGQFAFIPSHKIVFSNNGLLADNHQFPAYKKLRKEFKV